MDENATSINVEEQQSQAAGTTTTAEQSVEATPQKVSTLQKFIDGLFSGKDTAETAKDDTAKTSESKADLKSFTEDDVNSAVEAARKKWLSEQAEAERIKALSPEEKAKDEQLKKDEELTDLKNQLLQRELRDKAIAELDREGYPVKLAETLNYTNKEKMEENLKSTMEVFKESLKTAVDTRLKGKTPEGLGGAASAENMIKDQIAKNIRGGFM